MTKTRVQLSAIAFVLGYVGYLFLVNLINGGGILPGWKAFLMYLDVTFLTTALGILGCTFIRAKQLANGAVCFMPNHPLVRLGLVSKRETNLCPTFWFIGTVIALAGLLILFFLGCLVGAIAETINGNFVEKVGLPLLTVAIFIGVFSLFGWLATKDFWLWKAPLTLFVALLAIVFLYLLPMAQIEKSYDITFRDSGDWIAGTIIYLKWLGAILGSLAVSVTTIYLAFKHWGVLSSSWLGKQIALLKEKLCVRFVECQGS